MSDKSTPKYQWPKALTPWQERYVAELERTRPFMTVFPSMALGGCRTWRDYFAFGHGDLPDGPTAAAFGEE